MREQQVERGQTWCYVIGKQRPVFAGYRFIIVLMIVLIANVRYSSIYEGSWRETLTVSQASFQSESQWGEIIPLVHTGMFIFFLNDFGFVSVILRFGLFVCFM